MRAGRFRHTQVMPKQGQGAAELSQLGNIVVEKHHPASNKHPYRVSSGD
jgi:hypothetical protein